MLYSLSAESSLYHYTSTSATLDFKKLNPREKKTTM